MIYKSCREGVSRLELKKFRESNGKLVIMDMAKPLRETDNIFIYFWLIILKSFNDTHPANLERVSQVVSGAQAQTPEQAQPRKIAFSGI